jgi:hypothetical protein
MLAESEGKTYFKLALMREGGNPAAALLVVPDTALWVHEIPHDCSLLLHK